MATVPPRLRDSLEHAPAVVVAPVGVGFGQDALIAWAGHSGRETMTEPAEVGGKRVLLICSRRSQLASIPATVPLDELLVLEEDDLVFDEHGWRAALARSSEEFAQSTYDQCEGWPAGLAPAARIADSNVPLHQHPWGTLFLERLLEPCPHREALTRAAHSPLLVPELHEPLGLASQEVDDLLDYGYLRATVGGLATPLLLRRYLCPRAEFRYALDIATILADRRHLDSSLTVLREAELWEPYLELLAQSFEPGSAGSEKRLRRALRGLPAPLRETPAYLYLLGALERLRGEMERAQEHYRVARRHATGSLRARIDNARGITFAMKGELERARKAFGAATRGSGSARLEGEARHNRAGVSIRQGRFDEAEQDLRRAVTRFRESGDYVREARSLQLLALAWHQRGLLTEARSGYEEALELLGTLGQSTALLRTNLAEVLLLTGLVATAKEQLEQAAVEAQNDARASGYVDVNLALWLLSQGQCEAAARRLEALLRRGGMETHLSAEAELLLARALRLQGRAQEALAHAERARSVGVAGELEVALCGSGDLGPVIEQARREEARFELASALIHQGKPGDLEEALELIRTHDYRILLEAAEHAPALAALAQNEPELVELFPLRVTTFGSFRLRFLGRVLTLADFPTRKSAALLLRLALQSRPLSREALAQEFWSDAGNPLQSLQTALYHLNRTLGAQVMTGRKGAVELAYPAILDLSAFEEAASETLESSWTRGAQGVRRVLALADGEVLAEFPEWFEEERRHAQALVVRLWRRLVELEAPQPERAAQALEALVRLDPFDVDSRRNLIEIYSLLGEADQARRQVEQLRALESEL